jgi:NADH dehydrogenase FAD-containing subunit
MKIVFPYDPNQILLNHENFKTAKQITLIGTGPVGVEILGEIAMTYPNTKITAISQASRLLERQNPSAHKVVMNYLKQFKNVEVLFQKSVTKIEGKKVFFKKSITEKSHKNVEESLESDIAVICVGLVPSTNMFKYFMADSLNIRGYVEVNDFFQVKFGQHNLSWRKLEMEKEKQDEKFKQELLQQSENMVHNESFIEKDSDEKDFDNIIGDSMNINMEDTAKAIDSSFDGYSNIFAIGDIANLKDEKLAYFSTEHANRVASTIKSAESSNDFKSYQEKLVPYKQGKAVLQYIAVGDKAILMKGLSMIARGAVVLKIKDTFESFYLSQRMIE